MYSVRRRCNVALENGDFVFCCLHGGVHTDHNTHLNTVWHQTRRELQKKTDGRWPLDFGVSPSVVAGLASLADLLFFLTKTSVVSLCLLKAVQIPDSLLLFSLFHVSRSPLVLLHSLSGCNGGGISVTINNIFGMFLKLLAVLLILLFKPAMTMMNIVQ